jgi:hypothetical protein
MTDPTHEDMPWVIGLTDEEVQELRNKKHELTQYGKEKIRQLMTDGKLRVYDERTQEYTILDDGSSWGKVQTPKMKLEVKEMTHEEMLEEAERREKENKVLEIAKNFMEEHKEAFQQLAEIERRERAQQIVDATMELTLRPQQDDRKKVVACVIREIADRLCTDCGELQHPYDVLNQIADEVEAL